MLVRLATTAQVAKVIGSTGKTKAVIGWPRQSVIPRVILQPDVRG